MKRQPKIAWSRSRRATKLRLNGGYDDGYSRCPCFWGRSPGSLVQRFIANVACKGLRVLDLGCGEGKNAYALAHAGALVTAVDCSELAIANGRRAFADGEIDRVVSEGATYLLHCEPFDVIVMYGLLHCLPSLKAISTMIASAIRQTRRGGYHIVATFNDGPHDLSAHPGSVPTLAPHDFYLRQYGQLELVTQNTEIIHEVHPHNSIPHYHSLTRLIVRRPT
jgi:2-polyprenyl-3-methyl-5-hydroxy-6-metoxy-1,4-benzoquinol methylase